MKKRVFVAIDISDEARRKVSAYINDLRRRFPKVRVGWEKPEKLHLTMKFLGGVEDEQFGKLIEAVEKTALENLPFKLRITGGGVFPSPKRARILWLGIKDEKGSLLKLNEILENECEKQGFEKENRNFKAHLTIARLKENSNELAETHLRENFYTVEFEVSDVVIYRSELQPTGSVYSVVSKHDFKKK